MRRLPVIQPSVIERRAFLLGLVATVAACSSSEGTTLGTTKPTGSSGTSGSSGSEEPDAGDDDEEDASTGPHDAGGSDSSTQADTSTGPTGCAAAGVDIGAPSKFAMGTLTFVEAQIVYVGRDANGLYAMYGLCTHALGNMQVQGNGLTCLVHGAQFSITGDVTKGPAVNPLPHFALCLNSKGNVAVDTKTVVPSATRLVA